MQPISVYLYPPVVIVSVNTIGDISFMVTRPTITASESQPPTSATTAMSPFDPDFVAVADDPPLVVADDGGFGFIFFASYGST